jgi:soluble lytic murein transglycosylase-like protein
MGHVGANLDSAFEGAGKRFRLDPDLGRAMTLVESNFNPLAVSPKGARGLMQLMPGTGIEMRVLDPFNGYQSIYGGMEYLRQIANTPRFAGNPYLALVAYNAGPNRTTFPASSYDYADHVILVYWRLKAGEKITPHPIDYLMVPRCGQHGNQVAKPLLRFIGGKLEPTRHYP